MQQALARAPEFEAAGLTSRFRMVFDGNTRMEIDGRVYRDRGDCPSANFEQVTGGYFAVAGQKLLEGRTFTEDDLDARQPVAIVNDAFAQKHFGKESALGRRFRTATQDGNPALAGPWRTIIGVVSTVRMMAPFNQPGVDETGFYVPFYATVAGPLQKSPFYSQFSTILLQPRGGQRADAMAVPLRRIVSLVATIVPAQRATRVDPMTCLRAE